MNFIRKFLTLAVVATGAAATSQAPEFTQQYSQRIGGAVEELRTVATAFDADAAKNGLDRTGALSQMKGSPDGLVQDRSQSMHTTLTRLERLEEQQQALQQADPALRPAIVAAYPDSKIITDAWGEFEPAVPLGVAGAIWAAFGALLAWLLAATTGRLTRRKGKQKGPNNGVEILDG